MNTALNLRVPYAMRLVRLVKCRKLRLAGNEARMKDGRNAFGILTGKHTGNRYLGRPRRRWEETIAIGIVVIAVTCRNLIDSA